MPVSMQAPTPMPVSMPADAANRSSATLKFQEDTMTRTMIRILTVIVSTLVAQQAQADTRVTVHGFYGPNAERVREDVVNLLERQSGVTIISQGQVEDTAAQLGVDAYSPQGRIALGRELQLSAWMSGVVQKRSGKLKLTVVVFDGAQHLLVGRARLIGRNATKLSAEIKGNLWRKSRKAIMRALAPAVASKPAVASDSLGAKTASDSVPATSHTETPVLPSAADVPAADLHDTDVDQSAGSNDQLAAAEPRDDGVETTALGNTRGESLRAFIGFGSPYRSLAYINPITSSLGDYRLSGSPMIDLNVAFHPARPFTNGWPAWIGLDLRAQLALSTPTVDRDGNQFKSRYDAYHVGLRVRVPIGKQYVSAFSGYAMNGVSISSQNRAVSSPTPSVDYRMIRSGAGAELALSDSFVLGLDAAWLNFLSVGDIGRWFPRASAGGVEVAMFATYALTPDIFARASTSYQRTFFDFNTRPGDKYAAAGATDEFLAMSLGAGIRL
jgi:hypothetical protein